MYTSDRRDRSGRGWSTDYPFADINFMIRFSELTSTQVNLDGEGEPNHWVVPISDDALFGCPFVMTSDVGTMKLSSQEAKRLRTYLLKGGFLWVDDFWGSRAWDQWSREIGKVLPRGEYPIVDLPLDHELFRTMFNILEISADLEHSLLAKHRGANHLRTGGRQCRTSFSCDHRSTRTYPRRYDSQHRHPRCVGARGRGPEIFRPICTRRLRARC